MTFGQTKLQTEICHIYIYIYIYIYILRMQTEISLIRNGNISNK